MNARLSASIQSRKARFQPFHCCPSCEKPLSIAEVIERHCERCGIATEPQEVRAHHV